MSQNATEELEQLWDKAAEGFRKLVEPAVRAQKAMDDLVKTYNKQEAQTRQVQACELQKGDVIVEYQGRKSTKHEVDHVEHKACSSYGTHVNKKWCYETRAPVWILA